MGKIAAKPTIPQLRPGGQFNHVLGQWGLHRGKAAGAFAETGVMNETCVVGDATPLGATCATVRVLGR